MSVNAFAVCMPAQMASCNANRSPDFDGLVKKGKEMMEAGMSAVIYSGSMGDWPLLTEKQRMEGVEWRLKAGVPVVVGTGAVNTKTAVANTTHAVKFGARGLMIVPRVLSRGSSIAVQRALCQETANGDSEARLRAMELEEALSILSGFDEGPDLVPYYLHLMVMNGDEEYRLHFNETDELSDTQRNYIEAQYKLFLKWYANWTVQSGIDAECV